MADTVDPLAGIPEPHRTRIHEEAARQARDIADLTRSKAITDQGATSEAAVKIWHATGGKAYRDAIAAGVAAYRAAQPAPSEPRLPGCPGIDSSSGLACCGRVDCPHIDATPETLTREEAGKALCALGISGDDVAYYLENATRLVAGKKGKLISTPGLTILSAYVRHLDKQAPPAASQTAMTHSADFCCPKCGTGEWRTVNASDPVEEWEGSCANCRFRWLRKDDAKYFKPSREQERAAWARLVKATEVRWREDVQGAAQCDYQRELEAAKQALRDCGVDVDALLKEPS
jgi:hypothetical protein